MYAQEFFLLHFADFCLCLYTQEFFLLHFADLSLILVLKCGVGFKPCLPWSGDHQTSHCISVYWSFATLPTAASTSFCSIKFFNVYAQEFQSAHVHNNLSNFQKADGVAVMMGQLS